MKPSPITQLLRPWRTYRDGQPFYGWGKRGNNRWPLTTKQGNKNFYKGTGSSGIGRWTTRGRYIINWGKVRTYKTPAGLDESPLQPLVCATSPMIKQHFRGYKDGAMDGKLYIQKLREYVEFGQNESTDAQGKGNVERG